MLQHQATDFQATLHEMVGLPLESEQAIRHVSTYDIPRKNLPCILEGAPCRKLSFAQFYSLLYLGEIPLLEHHLALPLHSCWLLIGLGKSLQSLGHQLL